MGGGAEAGARGRAGAGVLVGELVLSVLPVLPAVAAVGASDGDRQVWAAKGGLYSLVCVWLEPVEWHGRYIQIRAGADAGAGDGWGGRDRKFGEV